MSTSSDADFSLELHFLPAWAQKGPEENRYADYKGEPAREGRFEGRGRGRDRGGDRGPRDRNRPPRRSEGPEARGPRPPQGQGHQGRPQGQGRPPRREGRGRFDRQGPPPPPPAPLPEVNCTIVSDDKSVDLLSRQIKMTGRAYPLFDIAQMILAKPERHTVTLSVKKDAEGKIVQPIYVCAVDETPWLSEDEAVQHLLNRHFNLFYQAERTATEPPKGVYTFVAQCGMSGVILGPPNYHDYQNRLRKLHSERFSKMPFEAYKARVKIVRDEAVVKKWIEDQSWKTEYVCLNLPEPLKLPNREEVEKHFRQVHLPNVIKQVETLHMTGTVSRNIPCFALRRLVRQVWDDQRRFPLQVAVVLSQQFAARGLQFFKVNKTVTHVAVARPHYLDLDAVPVSEGVRQIVNYVNAHPRCSRRDLVEALAPTPIAPIPVIPAPVPVAPPAPVEGAAPAEATPAEAAPAEAAPAAPPAPTVPAEAQPTPEQTAVIADLHWLVHQGHVIEFANGTLETAKKPLPKPPKPAPAQPAPEATAETATTVPAAAPAEGAPTPSTEGETPTASDTTVAPPSAESLAAEASVMPPPPPAEPTAEIPPAEAQPSSAEPSPAAEANAPVPPSPEQPA